MPRMIIVTEQLHSSAGAPGRAASRPITPTTPPPASRRGINYSDATPDLAYASDRLGQTQTVSDSTAATPGAVAWTFNRDPGKPWRLASTTLPAGFYGSRVLTPLYESLDPAVNPAGVLGRYRGFQLGTAANPDADLQQTYGYTSAGRFETLTSSLSPSLSLPSRTFTYGYLPDAPLVGSLHSATGVHDFFVTRTYDPQRDLLASLRADWDAATVTRYDYTHDTSGRRISRAQSGSAFADYGEPTFRRYTYNARSEVTGAPDYLGAVVTDTTQPLPGRQHAYDFDSLGNRKWADRTGDPTQREDYTTNALNQIVTKENLSLPAQGTVDSATTTVSADGAPATARQGRFFLCRA